MLKVWFLPIFTYFMNHRFCQVFWDEMSSGLLNEAYVGKTRLLFGYTPPLPYFEYLDQE